MPSSLEEYQEFERFRRFRQWEANSESDLLAVQTTEDLHHVDFMFDGSDIVLLSSDNVKFQTHSFILKVASGVFRTTLSLPQAAGTFPQEAIIGPLQEDARTINAILRIVSAMELPTFDNFEDVEKVLLTAEKWDMPAPLSIIRRITMPSMLLNEPLRLYVLACRFGWIEATKVASTGTLDLDFNREDLRPLLHTLESRDLLKLLDLRTRRRDLFWEFLRSYNPRTCSHELHGYSSHLSMLSERWEAVKWQIFIAIDQCPSGKFLMCPQSAIQSVLQSMRGTNCHDKPAYDMDKLKEVIWEQLAKLPQTI